MTAVKHYDKGTLKVIGFASVVIVFSMLLIGMITYWFTEAELVKKWKDKDLVHIAESMAAKVDGHIEKAKETSLVLAKDPELVRWIEGQEADDALKQDALKKLELLAKEFGYSNSFVVSAMTRHYWSEKGIIIDTVSENDPDDRWFFELIESGKLIEVQVDYNEERKDTFVFVNALMRNEKQQSLAIAGVGMSLQQLSKQFQEFKYGENSHLWLVNSTGEIVLSDRAEHFGKPIRQFVAQPILDELQGNSGIRTTESDMGDGTLMDMISYPLHSTGLQLLFQVERKETVSSLNNIKTNTVVVSLFSFLAIMILFYWISHRLANPYQRALQLNQELEEKVQQRTQELAERNAQLTDSIDYAKRIQESLLPQDSEWIRAGLLSHLVWKPRDVVGGDFCWVKKTEQGAWVGLGDCTGHGVPGAFMTMLAISLLDRVAEQEDICRPADVLQKLNVLVKQTLHQEGQNGMTDDGFDLGLAYVDYSASKVIYAGAKIALYVKDRTGVRILGGSRKAVGYRRTPEHYMYEQHEAGIGPDTSFYMATDGLYDQRSVESIYGFGKKRFIRTLQEQGELGLKEQMDRLWGDFTAYMGTSSQRDDIALLGFQMLKKSSGPLAAELKEDEARNTG